MSVRFRPEEEVCQRIEKILSAKQVRIGRIIGTHLTGLWSLGNCAAKFEVKMIVQKNWYSSTSNIQMLVSPRLGKVPPVI